MIIPEIPCDQPIQLSSSTDLPEQFHVFDPESVLAIKAALGAMRPLLVRGEPGVGKTQLALAAAKVLKRPLVKQVVDARTEARDLLWEFDAIQRLAEAQLLGALGGRMDSGPVKENGDPWTIVRDKLAVARYVRPRPLWWAFDWSDAGKQAQLSGTAAPIVEDDVDPKNGCVVLIDEIDKAEADLPNGLLEALGSGQFTPQGRLEPVIMTGALPLVVITTNEERSLPDAFVRRCLVLHLRLPEEDDELIQRLITLANAHFPEGAAKFQKLFDEAAKLLVQDRRVAKESHLRPLPGQAEYLDLLRALRQMFPGQLKKQTEALQDVGAFVFKKYLGGSS
jgi:MoxR-like ATPase